MPKNAPHTEWLFPDDPLRITPARACRLFEENWPDWYKYHGPCDHVYGAYLVLRQISQNNYLAPPLDVLQKPGMPPVTSYVLSWYRQFSQKSEADAIRLLMHVHGMNLIRRDDS